MGVGSVRGFQVSTTHDYTRQQWGRSCSVIKVEQDGLKVRMTGFGTGITAGDFILLPNGPESTRYRVETIEYPGRPRDFWTADLSFSPRTHHD